MGEVSIKDHNYRSKRYPTCKLRWHILYLIGIFELDLALFPTVLVHVHLDPVIADIPMVSFGNWSLEIQSPATLTVPFPETLPPGRGE